MVVESTRNVFISLPPITLEINPIKRVNSMDKKDDIRNIVSLSKEYKATSEGLSEKRPYIGAFVLSGNHKPDAIEYVGHKKPKEKIRIPKHVSVQLSHFYDNPTKIPERIYVKWDGDLCLLSEDHIPPSARSFLDRGNTIETPVSEEPVVFSFESPYGCGKLVIESPEKGSHVLGIAKISEEEVIYKGHGTVRMPYGHYEDLGRPDRVCVDWDGEKDPDIFSFDFKKMIEMGIPVKTEEELIGSGYITKMMNLYGQTKRVLTDIDEKNFFLNVPGTKTIFRQLKPEEILHNYDHEKGKEE